MIGVLTGPIGTHAVRLNILEHATYRSYKKEDEMKPSTHFLFDCLTFAWPRLKPSCHTFYEPGDLAGTYEFILAVSISLRQALGALPICDDFFFWSIPSSEHSNEHAYLAVQMGLFGFIRGLSKNQPIYLTKPNLHTLFWFVYEIFNQKCKWSPKTKPKSFLATVKIENWCTTIMKSFSLLLNKQISTKSFPKVSLSICFLSRIS